jgi:CubicO group peptidase (beta-lactamase class C family)
MRRTIWAWLPFVFSAALAQSTEPGPLAQAVQPFVERGEFAGAVMLVTSKRKFLDIETAGFADVEHRKPMRPDTLGNIASTGKPMIAAVLMMLVDDGKIGLDEPVSHYLSDFKPLIKVTTPDGKGELRPPVHAITVRMLLNHTHGLTPDFSSSVPVDSMPLPVLISDYLGRPLAHEPGTAFMYSGVGANVIARVVEVVSGRPFEQVLQRRLLDPLGMKDTTFFPTDAQLARLALSYWIPPGSKQLTVTTLPGLTRPFGDRRVRFAPAGGLFSSAPDMARFAQLFLNRGTFSGKRYLSESSVARMTSNSLSSEAMKTVPQPPGVSERLSYGLGWGVSDTGAYFHPGTGGVDISVDPSRSIAVVLLPQCGTDWSFAVRAEVMATAKVHFIPVR